MTSKLKSALIEEAKAWKLAFGQALNAKAGQDMTEIEEFLDSINKRLSRKIKDLDDVRAAMAALNEIRENEIRIDMTIGPIEESYAMLNKYELFFHDGNAEKVDTLSYSWKNLNDQVGKRLIANIVYHKGVQGQLSPISFSLHKNRTKQKHLRQCSVQRGQIDKLLRKNKWEGCLLTRKELWSHHEGCISIFFQIEFFCWFAKYK